MGGAGPRPRASTGAESRGRSKMTYCGRPHGRRCLFLPFCRPYACVRIDTVEQNSQGLLWLAVRASRGRGAGRGGLMASAVFFHTVAASPSIEGPAIRAACEVKRPVKSPLQERDVEIERKLEIYGNQANHSSLSVHNGRRRRSTEHCPEIEQNCDDGDASVRRIELS